MENKKKYSKSQLRWLAENLTSAQMNYLMENTDAFPSVDAANGKVEQTAGNQFSSNQTPNQPQQNNQHQTPQNNHPTQPQKNEIDKAQVSTVCKAIKNGKLNTIEPSQLNTFLTNANISTKSVAQAVKFAIDFLHNQMQNPKTMNFKSFSNTVSGIKNCLGALTQQKNVIAESMFNVMRKNGVNINSLANDIRSKNKNNIMKAGAVCFGLNESSKNINIKDSVNKYYELSSQIKNLETLAESCKIDSKKLHNKKNENKINESVSAIKYSIAFYNRNK